MKKFITIFFTLFFLASSLNALTLNDAIKETLKKNHEIVSQKYFLSSSKYKYNAAKDLRMPSFLINTNLTQFNKEKKLTFSTPFGPQTINMSEQKYIDLTTGINLNLYTGGLISGLIDKSFFEENISKHKLKETILDKIYNVKIAYLNILELKSFEKIALKHLKALEKHYNDAKELYNQGIVSYLDLLQTDVKLKEAQQNLISIKNNIKVAKTNLSLIMGNGPSDNITVENLHGNYIKNFKINRLYSFAKKRRPILKIINDKIMVANSEIKIARSGILPKVSIFGGYNYSDAIKDMDDKGNFLIKANITFQLDWTKSINEMNSAKSGKLALINLKKDIESSVYLGVKKAFEDYSSAVSNLKVAKSSVKSAREYFRSITLKYREGLADNSDLLDAEALLTRSLMTTKTYYYNIIKKYFLLERVTGGDLK